MVNDLVLRRYRTSKGKLIEFEKSAHPDKFFFVEHGTYRRGKTLRDMSTIEDVEGFLLELGCVKEAI